MAAATEEKQTDTKRGDSPQLHTYYSTAVLDTLPCDLILHPRESILAGLSFILERDGELFLEQRLTVVRTHPKLSDLLANQFGSQGGEYQVVLRVNVEIWVRGRSLGKALPSTASRGGTG